jgi:hypothetical protein
MHLSSLHWYLSAKLHGATSNLKKERAGSIEMFIPVYQITSPIPVTARSKTWVCGSSLAGIAGSNLTGGMDVSCECCVLSDRGSLRWSDHSSRGVLQRVACLSVIAKPRQWGGLRPLGLSRHWKKKLTYVTSWRHTFTLTVLRTSNLAILKRIFKKQGVIACNKVVWFTTGPRGGPLWRGNEPAGSTKDGEVLEELREWELHNRDGATWSFLMHCRLFSTYEWLDLKTRIQNQFPIHTALSFGSLFISHIRNSKLVSPSDNLTNRTRFLCQPIKAFSNKQKDRQCTYNVTFSRVRVTNFAVEKQ